MRRAVTCAVSVPSSSKVCDADAVEVEPKVQGAVSRVPEPEMELGSPFSKSKLRVPSPVLEFPLSRTSPSKSNSTCSVVPSGMFWTRSRGLLGIGSPARMPLTSKRPRR